jgi:hypothetical protein
VRYVDCIDNDTIIKKAAENPGSVGREIPRIDWVWTPGKRLRSCIPAHVAFDYCVATHVMEHVPDTIGWLNQILEVMHDGAVLALALPDRRYGHGLLSPGDETRGPSRQLAARAQPPHDRAGRRLPVAGLL